MRVVLSEDAHIPIPILGMLDGKRNFSSGYLFTDYCL
jgi:hypothetical protein